MAVGKNQTISLGPVGVLGIMAQNVKIKGRKNIRHIQRPGHVSGASLYDHLNTILTNLIRHLFQEFNFFFVEVRHGLRYNDWMTVTMTVSVSSSFSYYHGVCSSLMAIFGLGWLKM